MTATIELTDGRVLYVETPASDDLPTRCFHRLPDGALVWAHLTEVAAHGIRTRFYGFAAKTMPPSIKEDLTHN